MFPMRNALRPLALLLLIALPFSPKAQTRYDEAARAYVARYKDLAISEQKRTGIPAAIKLAQGIYETAAGTSELATEANNHFGMKCKKNWTGETFAHTDDAPNECFRKYRTAEESYRDQGNYLRSNPRYAACFATDVEDYRRWAAELRRAGYATNPKYADKIAKTVEDYGLQQYTLIAEGKDAPQNIPVPTNAPVIASQPPVQRAVPTPVDVNTAVAPQTSGDGRLETYKGLQGFYARKGQSLLEAATRYNVRYAKLLEWNELADAPVPYDMFIFLEKKATRGSSSTHVVKAGETMHKIAQAEAMQLGSLRQLNMIDFTEEPQAGVILQLQRAVTNRPAVYLASQPPKAPEAIVEVVQQQPIVKTEERPEMPVVPVAAPQAPNASATEASPSPIVTQVVEPETSAVAEPVVPTVKKAQKPKARTQEPESAVKRPASRTEKGTLIAKADISDTPAKAQSSEDNEPVSTAMPDPTPLSPVSAPVVATTGAPDAPAVPAEKLVETPDKPLPEYDDTPLGRLKAKMDRAVYAKRETPEPEPVVAAEAPKTVTATATPAAAGNNRPAFHTIAKGETVFSIAKKYGVSVTDLRKWNGNGFSAMKVGQKLKLKP